MQSIQRWDRDLQDLLEHCNTGTEFASLPATDVYTARDIGTTKKRFFFAKKDGFIRQKSKNNLINHDPIMTAKDIHCGSSFDHCVNYSKLP